MSLDTNVIWRRGDGAMPEHAKCVVEAAQNELLLKSLHNAHNPKEIGTYRRAEFGK